MVTKLEARVALTIPTLPVDGLARFTAERRPDLPAFISKASTVLRSATWGFEK